MREYSQIVEPLLPQVCPQHRMLSELHIVYELLKGDAEKIHLLPLIRGNYCRDRYIFILAKI
jgi:hypothetical protein